MSDLAEVKKQKTDRYREEDMAYWQKHILAYDQSNQTRVAYCRSHNVNYARFQYWYHRRKKTRSSTVVSKAIPVKLRASEVSLSVLCTLQCQDKVLNIHTERGLEILLRYL